MRYSVVGRPKAGLVDHGGIDDALQRHIVVAGEGGGGGVVAAKDDGVRKSKVWFGEFAWCKVSCRNVHDHVNGSDFRLNLNIKSRIKMTKQSNHFTLQNELIQSLIQ